LSRINIEIVKKAFMSFSYDWIIIVVDFPCYNIILMLIIIMMVDAYFKCNLVVCYISDESSTTKLMRQNNTTFIDAMYMLVGCIDMTFPTM